MKSIISSFRLGVIFSFQPFVFGGKNYNVLPSFWLAVAVAVLIFFDWGSWQVLTGKPDVISYAREKDQTWRRRRVNRKNQLKKGHVSWNEEVWKIEKSAVKNFCVKVHSVQR